VNERKLKAKGNFLHKGKAREGVDVRLGEKGERAIGGY